MMAPSPILTPLRINSPRAHPDVVADLNAVGFRERKWAAERKSRTVFYRNKNTGATLIHFEGILSQAKTGRADRTETARTSCD